MQLAVVLLGQCHPPEKQLEKIYRFDLRNFSDAA